MTYGYPPATTSTQGLIALAGDLDGYNTTAFVPTINSLTGDGSGIITVIANSLISSSANSSLTVSTNKSGATLVLAAGVETTVATLSVSSFAFGASGTVASIELTHGKITAGGNGSDFKAIMGPAPGAETTAANFYLLPQATAPISTNYFLHTDGSLAYINDIYGSGLYFYSAGSTQTAVFTTLGTYLGGFSLNLNTGTTPSIQSGTSATSLTIGTNKSGATLAFQAGAAATIATLSSSLVDFATGIGVRIESLGGSGDGYVAVDNSGNLSFSTGSGGGGGGILPGTAGQIYVTDATPAANWTSLISYETTHGRFTAGNGGSDFDSQ